MGNFKEHVGMAWNVLFFSWRFLAGKIISIDWFKGKLTGKSHDSWENLWFPVDFPLSQPIDHLEMLDSALLGLGSWT